MLFITDKARAEGGVMEEAYFFLCFFRTDKARAKEFIDVGVNG
jgi:hypothetical protein